MKTRSKAIDIFLESEIYVKIYISELRATFAAQNLWNSFQSSIQGGANMIKRVLRNDVFTLALCILGWLSFFSSFFTDDLIMRMMLLTISRVLP
ncbi:hypothetical protein KAN5_11240 [Pseudoalteromonas sp. KAN5]|nr:hypothetical protein KAN5_11240 [Pseudoalteromonas sp. KAN5]